MIDQYIGLIYQALGTLSEGNVMALMSLFLVLALTEFGVPFPLVLQGVRFYIGYELGQGSMAVIPLILLFILGRQAGSAAVYWLARLLGSKFVRVFEKHYPSMGRNLSNLQERLNSRSPRAITTVLVGRFIPGLLVPTSLASGVIGLRYQYFALGTLLSSFVFDASFIALGGIWGKKVPYSELSANIWPIAASLAVMVCLIWAISRLLSRRSRCSH
jgi:membrane protein DedA with SNARE-associated domain